MEEGSIAGPSSSGSPQESQAGRAPRVTQRAPTSCQSCYKLKIKCSKDPLPCEPCIRRGLSESCARETVKIRGKLVGGAAERRVLTEADLAAENRVLRRKLARAENQLKGTDSQQGSPAPPEVKKEHISPERGAHELPPIIDEGYGRSQQTEHDLDHSLYDSDLAALGLQLLAEGSPDVDVNDVPEYRKRALEQQKITRRALLQLVPISRSARLVRVSINLLGWIHPVIHPPTFLQEHDKWIQNLQRGQLDTPDSFLALYFSIISTGLYHLTDLLGGPGGFSDLERSVFPKAWFDASLEALSMCDILARNGTQTEKSSFQVLQTICIMPSIAHSFDASDHVLNLLHAGNKLAVKLNIHLLTAETPHSMSSGLLRRELGRRIWICLFVGEALSPAAFQPGSIFSTYARSVEPMNLNDEQLSNVGGAIPLPENQSTTVTDLIAMGRMAYAFRRFSQNFYGARSIEEQWTAALEADDQLRAVLDPFPQLQYRPEAYEPVAPDRPYDYGPFARYKWLMSNLWRRIIVFRPFFAKSYREQGQKYLQARQIVLDSAKQMLSIRAQLVPSFFDRAWHFATSSVLACVVLGTEWRYGSSSPEEKARLRKTVVDFVGKLERDPSHYSRRSIALVRGLVGYDYEDSTASIQIPSNIDNLWPTGGPAPDVWNEWELPDWMNQFLRSDLTGVQNWYWPEQTMSRPAQSAGTPSSGGFAPSPGPFSVPGAGGPSPAPYGGPSPGSYPVPYSGQAASSSYPGTTTAPYPGTSTAPYQLPPAGLSHSAGPSGNMYQR